jgi:hypothetical protein
MSALWERFRALPRSAKWLVLAGLLLLAYFAGVEPAIDAMNRMRARADQREAELAALRTGLPDGGEAALHVRRFGPVATPGEPETRPVAFHRLVTEILARHGVKDHRNTTRSVALGQGPLTDVVKTRELKVERLVREVQFEASPEAVAAVVADLEKTPEVAAVSRVQLARSDEEGAGRVLRATISAEAWILVRKEAVR